MRRVLVAGLGGLFLLAAAALTGCGGAGKASIPQKSMELPKEGPVAAGAPAGGGQQQQQKKNESAQ
jgi:hypothetical protein